MAIKLIPRSFPWFGVVAGAVAVAGMALVQDYRAHGIDRHAQAIQSAEDRIWLMPADAEHPDDACVTRRAWVRIIDAEDLLLEVDHRYRTAGQLCATGTRGERI